MSRRGMTLVEMLVALAATLILMAAIARAFSAFWTAVTASRAALDLDGRLRTAAWRLRSDLAGTTARTLPPLAPESGEGYFEIIEGPATDAADASGTSTQTASVSGDFDDVLLFTTRNNETPFIGRAPTLSGSTVAEQNDQFESTLAEVAWFARPTPGSSNPVTYTLYRRQLLVMGYVGADPFSSSPGSNNRIAVPASPYLSAATSGDVWAQYYNFPCDVSARLEASTSGTFLYPNTIADLTRREARFMHNVSGTAAFPFAFVAHQTASTSGTVETLPAGIRGLVFDSTSQRQGEDVILTNVLAFDVRVFDPTAPVRLTTGSTPQVPGDPGFSNSASASGGFVDLGNNVTSNSLLTTTGTVTRFGGYGHAKSKLDGSATTRRTYDTWSLHYEANGVDEDGDGTVDEGTNGVDDDGDGTFDEPAGDTDGDGAIDDQGETDTLPPYPVPLRGVEVRIRCYDPGSRQVRQTTVRHTFVPN